MLSTPSTRKPGLTLPTIPRGLVEELTHNGADIILWAINEPPTLAGEWS